MYHTPPEVSDYIHGCSSTRYAAIKVAYRLYVHIRLPTYFPLLLYLCSSSAYSSAEGSLAVSVFRLDHDKPDQRLDRLENAGQKFDSTQHQFVVVTQAIAGATADTGSSGQSSPPPPGSDSLGFSSGSSSSGSGSPGEEHWSGIGESDQSRPLLHSSVIVLDGKLLSILRSREVTTERIRQASHSFLELDELGESAYLGRL